MNKKSVFPEIFDVFHVEYESGCTSLAYAPSYAVEVGDRVITAAGTGIAKASVRYCTADDDWFKLINGIITVDKITNKIIEVK